MDRSLVYEGRGREVLRHDRERVERDAKVRRATSTNLGSVDRSTG